MNLRRLKSNTHHRAFTLVEIMLVVALMVVIAFLALPILTNSFKYQRLKRAGDMVRTEMSKARVLAMMNEVEYSFVYFPETGQFFSAPFDQSAEYTLPTTQVDNAETIQPDFFDNRLPGGITFSAQGEITEDVRSQSVTDATSGGQASYQVLFYPDGTTQKATIYLKNARNEMVAVQLRSLTGVATVLEIENGATTP